MLEPRLAAVQMAGDEVPHGSWEKSPAANIQNLLILNQLKIFYRDFRLIGKRLRILNYRLYNPLY